MMNTTHRTFVIGLFVLFVSAAFSKENLTVVQRLPWSSNTNGVGYSNLPEGRYGPQAFQVNGQQIVILDNQNNMLKFFEQSATSRQVDVPQGCFDFVIVHDELLVHNSNQVWSLRNGKMNSVYKSPAQAVIDKIIPIDNHSCVIQHANGHLHPFDLLQRLAKPVRDNDTQIATVTKVNNRLAKVEWGRDIFEIHFPEQNLACLQLVGTDDRHNIYLEVETFIPHIPLHVKRVIRRYSRQGVLMSSLLLPVQGYAFIQNDLYLRKDGVLFQMFATKSGVEIIRWNMAQSSETDMKYPDAYYDYDNEALSETPDALPELQGGKERPQSTAQFPQVTPEEALATGDTYVQLQWECYDDNVTNGIITDEYGIKVQTPSWVVPGSLSKVPYKWGGFQTLEQFVNGIDAGKYAGDRYTSKSSGTSSAVGVDCSGFVSRCWKLPSHYSTRAMDDAIALPYDSWEQAKPGDVAHKPGHVRLIVENNPNGTLKMVEAAGYNWRVSYRSYSYAELYNYTPRYYINMQGTPGNIPQPQLAHAWYDGATNVQWNVSGLDAIAELKLYESADGAEWSQIHSVNKTSSQHQLTNGDGGVRYFKMTSVSTSDGSTEGLPSDVYGAFSGSSAGRVLIVDGFDRINATSGSWGHVYHSFAVDYGQALHAIGISFETVSNDAVLAGIVNLADYAAVIWFVGDESTEDETFNTTEQARVTAYLQQGGNLFVTGSEVAWDLDYKGTTTDKSFFNNYLKSEYREDDSNSYTVNGVGSTPFSGLSLHYDNGTHGVYPEDYPDVLGVKNGSQQALRYANQKIAAIYYEGVFDGGSQSGKLFYMGFPFETIYSKTEQHALMAAIMDFFDVNSTTAVAGDVHRSEQFQVFGNYPNPFNGSTAIHYQTPYAGTVDLAVYNNLGQQVFSDHWQATAGVNTYAVDALHWPTGAYYYQLTFDGVSRQRGRLMLVK